MTDAAGAGASGSVTTTGGENFNNNGAGKTQRSFDIGGDARSQEGGGKNPYYWCHKTPSGHCFIMDDSKGNETVTLQHRSGTAIQMRPDGGMLLTTHNGKYEVVLGEERVTISGASDITVKGDTSLRCYGDYNVTVHKDYNLTVLGNMNMTAKNVNKSVRGTIDTEAKTINTKAEGPIVHNTQDSYAVSAKNNITNAAGGAGQYAFGGDTTWKAGVTKQNAKQIFSNEANNGETYHNSKGKKVQVTWGKGSGVGAHKYGVANAGTPPAYFLHINSASQTTSYKYAHDINKQLQKKLNVTYEDDSVHDHQGDHKRQVAGTHQTKANKIVSNATTEHKALAGTVMNMQSPTGVSTFAGGTTNVNALSGILNMVGSGGGINVDSLGGLLNLNGGLGALVSALQLSLPFDISLPGSPEEVPQVQGNSSSQPQEEPDASGEIKSWK